jgi:hypothetical protein
MFGIAREPARSTRPAYSRPVATNQREITPEAKRCIDACSGVYAECADLLLVGLIDDLDTDFTRLVIDCGEIAQTTGNALLRVSELSEMLATVCAEACEQLAARGEEVGGDRVDAAVEVLRQCADACHAFVVPV